MYRLGDEVIPNINKSEPSLTQRIINSGLDLIKPLLSTDYANKVLVFGDNNQENREIAKRHLIVAKDFDKLMDIFNAFLQIPDMKDDEKLIQQMVLSQWPGITEGLHDFLYEFTGTNRSDLKTYFHTITIKGTCTHRIGANFNQTIKVMMVNLGMILS